MLGLELLVFQLLAERIVVEALVEGVLVDDEKAIILRHEEVGVEQLHGRDADLADGGVDRGGFDLLYLVFGVGFGGRGEVLLLGSRLVQEEIAARAKG